MTEQFKMPFRMQIWDEKAKKMYKWDKDSVPDSDHADRINSIHNSGIVQLLSGRLLFLGDTSLHVRNFIGKYDTHGNEIYSGDILRELSGVEPDSEGFDDHYDYYLVHWCSKSCSFRLQMLFVPPDTIHSQLEDYDKTLPSEIVGNVFENHEWMESNAHNRRFEKM